MAGTCITCGTTTAGKGLRCKKCDNTVKNKSLEGRVKNSLAHKGKNNHFYGKKHTEEALDKMRGENARSYIDGRTKKFNNWRKEVLERDNYTCQVCGKTVKEIRLDCHHIKPKKEFPELQFETKYGDADAGAMMEFYPEYKITKMKLSEGTTIYALEHKKLGNKFQFASKSLVWPAGYAP